MIASFFRSLFYASRNTICKINCQIIFVRRQIVLSVYEKCGVRKFNLINGVPVTSLVIKSKFTFIHKSKSRAKKILLNYNIHMLKLSFADFQFYCTWKE